MSTDLFSAFIIGILGAGHCIGMCGGVSTMLVSALPRSHSKQQTQLSYLLAYNFGRIASYSFIGALVGFTGSIAAKNIGISIAGMQLVAAIFLILLGLYLGQWWMILTKVEAIGKKLWQYISPYSKALIPVNSPSKALLLGALWGWLPCGLVYSTLTWSLASGSAVQGGLTMLMFGLGTLPAMLSISIGALSVKKLLTNPSFRQVMAISIICYGFYSLFIAYKAVI